MKSLKILCVLVSAVVTFIPNQAAALTSNQVEEIARQISVKILSSSVRNPAKKELRGTGVIIPSPGGSNTYYMLTAKHIASASKNIKYTLVTPDGNSHEVNPGDIRDLPNMDLSLLKFVSYRTYKQATLGESDRLTLDDDIYIYGWQRSGGKKFVTGRFRRHIEQENRSRSSSRGLTDGYGITYNARTENGMSGGPVLDTDGRLVGIHGRGNRLFKLGIPIETFLNSSSSGLTWLRICNRMQPQDEIFIALVRYVGGGTGWESRGWYKTEPNYCQTFALGEEYRRNVYYYAESGEISWGRGSSSFCINKRERFRIQNSDSNPCNGNNLGRVEMTERQVTSGMLTRNLIKSQ